MRHQTGMTALDWIEKLVDLCVVNKTCISLTTVTEKNPFTTKLAYEVKETDN